jgi:DNA gyrase subunit A
VRTPVKDISVVGRNTQGVRLIRLEDGDQLSGLERIDGLAAEDEAGDAEAGDGEGGDAADEGSGGPDGEAGGGPGPPSADA